MQIRPRLLVVTDLDGTLLDHSDYSFAAAKPALAALKGHGVPLVLASSKTAAEIAALHAALDLGDTPAIVENGAAEFTPGDALPDDTAYQALRAALAALPGEFHSYFKGFGDMSDDEVAAITSLPLHGARAARRRSQSEPGLWSGPDAALPDFLAALDKSGIVARRGGRFLTLSYGGTKADRMAAIVARLHPDQTLALGDAPNDIEMIEAANHGVIVRNDPGTPIPTLAGEATGTIIRTTLPGPEGWNAAVLDHLDQIFHRKGASHG